MVRLREGLHILLLIFALMMSEFGEDCTFVSLRLAIAQTIETAALCMQTVTILDKNPEVVKTKTCGCFWSIHLSAMPGF